MKLFKGRHFDGDAARTAFRTTGALLAGNGPIGYLVLDKHDSIIPLTVCTVIGTCLVMALSFSKDKPEDSEETKGS